MTDTLLHRTQARLSNGSLMWTQIDLNAKKGKADRQNAKRSHDRKRCNIVFNVHFELLCRVVGWYHSHPTFATFPSMIDIANQVTQQNAHKTATCEPYIAAIVGPYSKKLPTCQSSMTWFYVNHESGRIPSEDENPLQAGCTPMQLQVRTQRDIAVVLIQC